MTEEETKAAEAIALATAQEEEAKKKAEEEAKASALGESEAKILALEAEKNQILEREANYKVAYLKEKKKNEQFDPEETDEERIRRITREELSRERIVAIDEEKESLLKKTLRENKELKLAIQNKVPSSSTNSGSHSENPTVVSTSVTPEQLAAFKARGWTEKDIERYKKNLLKYR